MTLRHRILFVVGDILIARATLLAGGGPEHGGNGGSEP